MSVDYQRAQKAAIDLIAAFSFDEASEGQLFWDCVYDRLIRIANGEPLSLSGTIIAPLGALNQPRPALPDPKLLEAAERVLRLRRPTSFGALDHVDVVALDLLHKSVDEAKGKVDDPGPEVPGF